MNPLPGFAYRLLQTAGSEISRLQFVHTIYEMIKQETGVDETELFFYHDNKLYQLTWGAGAKPALRLCLQNPLASIGSVWSRAGMAGEWVWDFFEAYGDDRGREHWWMKCQDRCHHFRLKEQSSGESLGTSEVMLVSFIYQHDKMGLVVLKERKGDLSEGRRGVLFQGMSQALSEAFEHQYAHHACQERVKELSCLYELSHLAALPDTGQEEVLHRVAMILPAAMQFPEIATARICLEDQCFISDGFQESDIKLTVPVDSKYRHWGTLEVFYAMGQVDFYDDIFLKEEEKLLQTVASQIALLLERKEAETLSRQLQSQLLHADRLATIGQLSAGVAHEINEPLGSILGFSQLLLDGQLDDQPRRDVERIIKATLHAREIIRKLMLFSRQMPPRKTGVDVNKIIEEGLFFLESRFAKNAIQLVRLYQQPLPRIVADPGQIHQIIVNLAVNSMHAMTQGGTFTIETMSDDHYVYIRTDDTGTGMSEDVQQKIFLPFFTTKDVQEGTGLGLSVVHGIVEAHNGSIEVESELGKGTVFTIRLPINSGEGEDSP